MKNTDKMKNIITFLLVFFTATTVWAEKVIVSGTVVDSNKEPLIGVNVTVKVLPDWVQLPILMVVIGLK